MARRFAAADGITLICGRFEGLDQRVIDHFGIEEVSLGRFRPDRGRDRRSGLD
jgi:tRNA (guanine37-N1)-methyltransferase